MLGVRQQPCRALRAPALPGGISSKAREGSTSVQGLERWTLPSRKQHPPQRLLSSCQVTRMFLTSLAPVNPVTFLAFISYLPLGIQSFKSSCVYVHAQSHKVKPSGGDHSMFPLLRQSVMKSMLNNWQTQLGPRRRMSLKRDVCTLIQQRHLNRF